MDFVHYTDIVDLTVEDAVLTEIHELQGRDMFALDKPIKFGENPYWGNTEPSQQAGVETKRAYAH